MRPGQQRMLLHLIFFCVLPQKACQGCDLQEGQGKKMKVSSSEGVDFLLGKLRTEKAKKQRGLQTDASFTVQVSSEPRWHWGLGTIELRHMHTTYLLCDDIIVRVHPGWISGRSAWSRSMLWHRICAKKALISDTLARPSMCIKVYGIFHRWQRSQILSLLCIEMCPGTC